MSVRKKSKGRLGGLVVLVLILAGVGYVLRDQSFFGSEEVVAVQGVTVRRGPLRISVLERGNLEAADSVEVRNDTERSATIVYLIDEGVQVQEGDLLCELDGKELEDDIFQREISVRNAEAAYVKSKQNFEIQESQNESDIARAAQALEFARTDLNKFMEADQPLQLQQADEEIVLASEEWERAKDALSWSEKLFEKGFLTQTELEADRLSLTRTQIQHEQAKRAKETLEAYELPKQEAQLRADLAEAERELARVELQAKARIADFDADLSTNEAKLKLESDKLDRTRAQLAACVMHAPKAGMVVYVKESGGRWGRDDPIDEGTTVKPRQGIISIPNPGGMIAEASLHESVLKQIEPGQPVVVRVDAMPDREFQGRVEFVAHLPDQNSYWANPNQRLYKTQVKVTGASEELRPGMSCAIEILVDDIEDTLHVPVQSVFRDRGESVAFVSANSGPAERRVVDVGSYNDVWVEVRSGLEEGETVLLAPPVDYPLQAAENDESEFDADETAGPKPMGGSRPDGDSGGRGGGERSGGKPSGRPTADAGGSKPSYQKREYGAGGAE